MKNRLVTLLIYSLVIHVLSPLSLHGQNKERFYNISRRDGLASGSVTSIAQDHQGLIWIGTKQGLNRYDGSEFLHYHTGNSKINSNDISDLSVDHSGDLWVGTFGSGLYRLKSGKRDLTSVGLSGIGKRIVSITVSPDSSVMVLSDLGLVRLKSGNEQEVIGLPSGTASISWSFLEFQESIWLGTSTGELLRMDQNDSYVSYILKADISGIIIQKIYPIDGNRLFIGTRQHGLWIFDLVHESFTKVQIDAVDIRDIVQDRTGLFWVGTDGHGVFNWDGSTWKSDVHKTNQENSLASNAIQTCFEDKDGNLWFGTAWDGISLIDRRFENLQFIYSDFQGVDAAGILSIFSENNALWLGTDGAGLSIYDPGNVGIERWSSQIPSDTYVHFIDKIGDSYWIGTFQSGFFLMGNKDTSNISHFTSADGLGHDDVRDIEQIGDRLYLIATWGGGLNIFDESTGRFRKISSENGQPKDVVTLQRVTGDQILVGTFGQGIFVFQPSDLTCRRIANDIHNVVSIGVNKKGIWIGTWGEGLYFIPPSFASTKKIIGDRLTSNANIFSILTTEEEVWLANNEQILNVRKDESIVEIPFPPQQYHINSANQDIFGRLYFGGTDGAISFYPKDIRVSTEKDIQILDVQVLNRSLTERQLADNELSKPELSHDENLVTFSYATPTFPSSRDEEYEIRLRPLHQEWINVGRQRSMTFADLNSGTYEFSVRNASSKIEESFRFIIRKPWWKTWWAYSLVSLIFLGLLYSFRRYSINLERMKSQLAIEKIGREKDSEIGELKQRFFVNISHEIRTPLTLIIGEIEQLATQIGGSKSLSKSINNLRNNGNHLIQLVNELLDFRKLDQGAIRLKVGQGNFVNFCREIYLSFSNKAEANNINFEFYTNQPTIQLWYDRDQLEKVFYNLISNAFKNTPPGGTIRFLISGKEGTIEATIEDTGQGIPVSELKDVFKRFYQKENDREGSRHGFGIGLSIVQEILNLHHGDAIVESEVGRGSKFTVRLRAGKDHFEGADFIPDFKNSDVPAGYHIDGFEGSEIETVQKKEEQILVVEDNEEIREFLICTLSSRYTVFEASDGKEALKVVERQLPDLIVSDIMMPEIDGITLTRKLKRNPTTSHIPIILLTARTGTVFKKEGFETGADDYITKPFNSSILLVRLENILKNRQALTQQIRNELATRPEDLNLSTPDEQFLKSLVKIIQQNLDNSELSAEHVGEEMGMSHSVVYKKLKALTGLRLVEFIRDYRLQQAAEMLTRYKFTVAEACYKVGFSDKKYFSQIFKKKFGMTPSEYAKNGPIEKF